MLRAPGEVVRKLQTAHLGAVEFFTMGVQFETCRAHRILQSFPRDATGLGPAKLPSLINITT